MRKLIFLTLVAALAVPAWATAGSPSAGDRTNAAKQCASEHQAMGTDLFKQTYGTNANKSNAFGKCVSQRAKQNQQARSNAAGQCRSERAADPAAFAAAYGTGKNHKNAFGKCVSSKAKSAEAKQTHAVVNAAKQCRTEQQADPAAFKAQYGTNANKSNAFGKCVSSKVKHTP
ncbi:MAG: hypothetical protein E6G15_01420 [Actinobacteria bacterium]|nr:MAG: hypothetical protein E6G15_01420 [Actinomycetota bacterium]